MISVPRQQRIQGKRDLLDQLGFADQAGFVPTGIVGENEGQTAVAPGLEKEIADGEVFQRPRKRPLAAQNVNQLQSQAQRPTGRERAVAFQKIAHRLPIDDRVGIEKLRVIASEAQDGRQRRMPQAAHGGHLATEPISLTFIRRRRSLKNVQPPQPQPVAVQDQQQGLVPLAGRERRKRAVLFPNETELVKLSEIGVAHEKRKDGGKKERNQFRAL